MLEYEEAIFHRYLQHYEKPFNIDILEGEITYEKNSDSDSINELKGDAMTSLGPAPYAGDILNDPEKLWTEDVWTDEKEQYAIQKISEQGTNVSSFWKSKYEQKAGSYWHQFYKRNSDHFYKDRHYLHVVFPELLLNSTAPIVETVNYCSKCHVSEKSNGVHLLEVGCGVGNAVIPLVELNSNLHIVAIDFAKSAIDILKQHPYATNSHNSHTATSNDNNQLCSNCIDKSTQHVVHSNKERKISAFVCCVVKDVLPVSEASMDLVLCMFVLSAISPTEQQAVICKLAATLKTGGKLLLRDYGRYDEAQLRFKKGSKLDDHFYVRQDGTCAYFFAVEQLRTMCELAGLKQEEAYYIRRQYANRQQKVARYRVWVHAKFVKL